MANGMAPQASAEILQKKGMVDVADQGTTTSGRTGHVEYCRTFGVPSKRHDSLLLQPFEYQTASQQRTLMRMRRTNRCLETLEPSCLSTVLLTCIG